MDNLIVTDLLKSIRSIKNYTQAQMASELGITTRTYQRYESAETDITISQLLRAMKIHGEGLYLSTLFCLKTINTSDVFPEKYVNMIPRGNDPICIRSEPYLDINKMHKSCLNKNETGTKAQPLVGYWDWNIDQKDIYWSSEMYQIYGIEEKCKDELSSDFIYKNIFKDDRKVINETIKNLIVHNISIVNSHKTHIDDNHYFRVNVIAEKTLLNNNLIVFGSTKAYLRKYSK